MNDDISQELDWRIRVFDSLSFPTLILKPDKIILTANRIFLEKYGLSMDQIVGLTCREVFYGSKNCPNTACPFAKVLADKEGHSVTRRVDTKTSKLLWEDRVFSPILDEKGEVAYIMESVRDITRIKSLEQTLNETKEFLEKIIHSSPMAIVAADRYGNILLMNQAAEELFGYHAETVFREIPVENLYPPGTAVEIMKKLRSDAFGGAGKLPATETIIRNSSGEEIPVELTAAMIYENEEEVATMGIYNDLREKLAVEEKLKQTLAQLAQSEKMASLGQLAAGVAHEINNPLTGILFSASLVLESLDETDANSEELANIVEDVNRCKDIVENLLAYGHQTSTEKSIIQLNDLVNTSLALIRDQRLFRNIHVVKSLSDEMMLVHVDRNQMNQVIINLVMNAVTAMNGKGTLTFKTYRNKGRRRVHLEVKDTGCGIAPENLSKIFDPFFTTRSHGKGTGLGLSTAFGIVKANKGHISVKKTGAGGTTFLIRFPLYTPLDPAENQ